MILETSAARKRSHRSRRNKAAGWGQTATAALLVTLIMGASGSSAATHHRPEPLPTDTPGFLQPAQAQQQPKNQSKPKPAQPAPTPPAADKTPKLVGTYERWRVYTYREGNGSVCFMISEPTQSRPNTNGRGNVFFTITHRPAEKLLNEVSFSSGLALRPGSEVQVEVSGQKFAMFTENQTAWVRDEATDKRLADAVREGSTMTLRLTPAKNPAITDSFSLAGSGKAYQEMGRACNLRP